MSAPRPVPLLRWTTAVAALALVAAACTAPEPPAGGPGGSKPARLRLIIVRAGSRLPAPVQREVAVSSGGTIYLAGGLNSADRSTDAVESIDPSTGMVTSLGIVPRAFHDAAGAVIGGKLLVFGGGAAESSDVVQSFDLQTDRGAVVGHMPVALSDLAAARVGGTVYLVGGWDGTVTNPRIYSTTDGTTFTPAGRLPAGLRYPAVAVVGTDLIVAGGLAGGSEVRTVFRFDTRTGKTSVVGSLPRPVAHAAAFTIGGTVYVVGGQTGSGSPVATVSSVEVATATIKREEPLRRPLSDAGVVQDASGAWLLGGWRGRAVTDVLHATRSRAAPPPQPKPTPPASATPKATHDALTRPFAGLLLIADRGNDRLLVMDAHKHIVWRYPSAKAPPPSVPFYYPDDAFWVHGGNAILVNEEDNNVLAEIAYPSGKTLWTYGHPRVSGSDVGFLYQPDDLYPYPGGGMVVADAKNCRILFFNRRGLPDGQIGTNGVCTHGLPDTVGYPNGDTPLPGGDLLISELNSGRIDRVTPTGKVVWSYRIPGIDTPSDPQMLPDGSVVSVDYEHPGGVVRFDPATGKVLWNYHPTTGPGVLNLPSLAAPLPNGLIAVNDDFNHRVVLIDPKTNEIVWQYGVTGQPGTSAGHLNIPDGLDLMLPGGVIPLHIDFPDPQVQMGRP